MAISEMLTVDKAVLVSIDPVMPRTEGIICVKPGLEASVCVV